MGKKTFKCEACGKVFIGDHPNHEYRFCSQTCAAKGKWDIYKDYDESLEWKKEADRWVCPYNEGAACRTRHCSTCGWNPVVAAARKKEAMA